ncbi:hypothetical protein OUZ56_020285 [Daphnia magna]|uniref:Protein kinase domain-containing protein n=1 Tax=Daphnia magna TaxID=35525 RepID=A0ABQ9ZE26_9CRUS|nr:hypothetical protein OUZ56_020285 [Daphnia magna]
MQFRATEVLCSISSKGQHYGLAVVAYICQLYQSSLFPFLIFSVQSDSGWQVNFVSVKLRVFPFGKVLISPLLRPTQLKMASPLSSSHAGNVHGIQFDRSHLFGEDGYTSVLHGTLNGQRVAIKRIEVTRGTNQTTDNK